MAEIWQSLEGKVDSEIHKSVMYRLNDEKKIARQWHDECLKYFSKFATPEAPNEHKK